MKPRIKPSRRTWGKMPIRSSRSIAQQQGRAGCPRRPGNPPVSEDDPPAPVVLLSTRLLLGSGRRRGDGQLLDEFVLTPLFRVLAGDLADEVETPLPGALVVERDVSPDPAERGLARSEEHTSELQSLAYLVCRLLLEKKK